MSRLARLGDIEAVRVQGKRFRTTQFEVRYLASPLRRPRVGVIVPLFGHTAVERNAVKRRLRELVRTALLPLLAPVDMIIRVSPAAYKASFDTLRGAVEQTARQLPVESPRNAT